MELLWNYYGINMELNQRYKRLRDPSGHSALLRDLRVTPLYSALLLSNNYLTNVSQAKSG